MIPPEPIDPRDPGYVRALVDFVSAPPFELFQVYEELLEVAHWIAGFRPHNVLEIGTAGGTFVMLSRLATGLKVSVDTRDLRALLAPWMDGSAHFVQGDSQSYETSRRVRAFGESFDLIFIDGDHSYSGVARDFVIYRTMLSPRGVILFHDVDPDHVFKNREGGECARFWAELDEGSKTMLCCSRSTGRLACHGHTVHFGGFGIWRP